MPADCVIVVDAGTSALRALMVHTTGAVTPLASEPWSIFVPEDAAPFGREFDAVALDASLERLIDAAAPQRSRISGVAVTGQREGLVFADAEGRAILASPNVDARAAAEGIAIDAGHGSAVYGATGHLPSLMQATAKWRWLANARPQDADRVRHVLPLADWLAMRLTGCARISRSLGVENGMCDVASRAHALPLLDTLGFPLELLPPVIDDGAIVGEVPHGSLAGLRVVAAGADTQCALVGGGATSMGDCGVSSGWSAPVQLVVGEPRIDAEQRTWAGVHVLPDRWVLESNAGETGRAWDWLCSMLTVSPADADGLAANSPRGARDTLTVLGPRVMHAARMNAGVGAIAVPLPFVMSAPERSDVLRSALEAIAFAVRANVEQLEAVSDTRIGSLRLGGGMSRSAVFARILADVLERPIELACSPETSALGAAALTAAALGLHASLDTAIAAMTAGRAALAPDARAAAEYDDYYERWSALCERLEMGGL